MGFRNRRAPSRPPMGDVMSPFWIHKNTKISWSHTNFSELRCASWPMVPVSNLKDFSGLSTHEIAEFAVTSGCATAGRAGWPKPPVWWQIPALSGWIHWNIQMTPFAASPVPIGLKLSWLFHGVEPASRMGFTDGEGLCKWVAWPNQLSRGNVDSVLISIYSLKKFEILWLITRAWYGKLLKVTVCCF